MVEFSSGVRIAPGLQWLKRYTSLRRCDVVEWEIKNRHFVRMCQEIAHYYNGRDDQNWIPRERTGRY
jgi:hypothetical protein